MWKKGLRVKLARLMLTRIRSCKGYWTTHKGWLFPPQLPRMNNSSTIIVATVSYSIQTRFSLIQTLIKPLPSEITLLYCIIISFLRQVLFALLGIYSPFIIWSLNNVTGTMCPVPNRTQKMELWISTTADSGLLRSSTNLSPPWKKKDVSLRVQIKSLAKCNQ